MKYLPFLLSFLLSYSISAQASSSPDSIASLLTEIASELKDNNVPAAGIAIVAGDQVLYADALGMKQRGDTLSAKNKADAHTLFRIGSISKMFVSLAVLKLQEEGKISLKDTVRKLVPEIEFTNPWAETNPILVEHLLEHTTGWDDLHITEYAHNDSTPATLKEGLDFYPASRTSRWIPGTRTSYCNSGPPMAAYIVERITGMRFEDYVQTHFFDPIGMSTATYFKDQAFDETGVTLYSNNEPQPYWHIIMRPSGAINASPVDMAAMVKFFVNHAQVDSLPLIERVSLDRMESPATTLGAKAGIQTGYGLSNYTSYFGDFLFHGHNGGVNGGVANLAYNRELGVGFAVMINSGNGQTLNQISKSIASFLTKSHVPPRQEVQAVSSDKFDGIYYAINPRRQITFFTDRLFSIKRVTSSDTEVYFSDFPSGKPTTYQPISEVLAVGHTGIPSLAVTEDPTEGLVLASGNNVYARTSTFRVYGSWIFTGLWLITLLLAGFWGLITVLRKLFSSVKTNEHWHLQLGNVIIAVSLCTLIVGTVQASVDPFTTLSGPTSTSILIFVSTLLFAFGSLYTVIHGILRFSKVKKNAIFWFFWTVAVFNLIVATYFWNFDLIGYRSWV